MNVIDYLKKNKISKLYHATYSPVIESIKESGLGAEVPERINAWNGLSAKYVYLAHEPGLAESYSESADNEELPEDWLYDIVVLEVKVEDLNLDYLDFDSNNQMEEPDRTFQYKGIIPWSSLKIVD